MMKVYTKTGGEVLIDESLEIQRGGEGAIIKIDATKVAKIYHSGISGISEFTFNHLKVLPQTVFVIPHELFYSKSGEILGFSMEYLGADFMPISNLFNKNFCDKHSISYNFKLKIAKQLIASVELAHKYQIVIGDFNQFNLLFSLSGEVKCIDTDSYQTPNSPHSGRLLDEIRDYLYHGIVSKNSDYFALSVILFYLFTFAHPFKGISQQVKKMQDRMILKLPIFAAGIIQPKVYTPIIWQALQSKFERFYFGGERFLLNLTDAQQISVAKKTTTIHISYDDLFVKQFLNHAEVIDIEFIANKGYAETSENFILFSASDKGNLHDFITLKKADFEAIFPATNAFFAKKGNKLVQIEKNGSVLQISNFQFSDSSRNVQYDDILLVVGNSEMFELSLNQVYNNSMQVKRTEIFSENMWAMPHFAQNTGGTYRLFYHTGTNLANVKIPIIPKQLKQIGNVGIVQYIENKQIKNHYFQNKGLKFELANTIDLPDFVHFTYQKRDKDSGFIYEAADNAILIRRSQNFEVFSSIQTELVSANSKLFHTLSGLVCLSDGNLYLLNKK